MITKSRMDNARDAAWRQFGRRHYRWFVYSELAARAAPWVFGLATFGAIVYGVYWAWRHVPATSLALVLIAAAVLLAVGRAGYETFSLSARRGVATSRLATYGASGALALAALASVMR